MDRNKRIVATLVTRPKTDVSSIKHNATDIPRITPIIALEEPLSKAMRQSRGTETDDKSFAGNGDSVSPES